MDRLQQKNELFMKLGALFGPLQHLAESPGSYNEEERKEAIARYSNEWRKLEREFRAFSTGQAGHAYTIERRNFTLALYRVILDLDAGGNLADILARRVPQARAAIAAIPIPRNATILEAQTPFSTYCKLKDLVEGHATSSLVWIDAYMDCSIFYRYLRNLRPEVAVTLVTCEPKPSAGKREQERWASFLDVSRLYAQERGTGCYRLVVHQGLLHDRWLTLDNKRLYTLGGSAKDAGDKQYFTLAGIDASAPNLEKVQEHVDTGKEYFGKSTPTHL
jgi:hypothetical protein